MSPTQGKLKVNQGHRISEVLEVRVSGTDLKSE